ncbi:hypothetical protein [Mycetocola miduiensis]|uniref:hypothetical protein n=1 Tax=Mycetocola miduiensis TaxID=995034 RepID=UPI000B83245C|nr:hypothetical protein [Mycetocola miduiensis]
MNAGAIALSLLAIAAPMVGLSALFGRPGLAIGAVLFVLVANPIASAALPLHFLPEPWGAIGASTPWAHLRARRRRNRQQSDASCPL